MLLFILPVLNCEDDEYFKPVESFNPTDFHVHFGAAKSDSFLGQVIDEQSQPIANAMITIGTEIAVTDARGVFSIKNARVFENFAYIKASKAGFVNGSRSLIPSDGANKLKIMLTDDTPITTINANEIVTVNLNSGVSITLNGAYVTPDGADYTGSVQVVARHINIETPNVFYKMQGMLYGQNTENEPKQLETFGMLHIKLLSSTGEELQLKEDEIALVHIPVGGLQSANTDAVIPLWYFNEEHGFWIENGEATFQSNEYIGEISQLAHWNFAKDINNVTTCINVQTSFGVPLSNIEVVLTSSGNTSLETRMTNEAGTFCNILPSEAQITVAVYNFCGDLVYSENLGTITNVSTQTIIIPDNVASSVILDGTFYDCDVNFVTDGYVFLEKDGYQYFDYINDGAYYITTLLCENSSDAVAYGIDLNADSVSNEIAINIVNGSTIIGAFSSCIDLEDTDEYIIYRVDNNATTIFIEDMYCRLVNLSNTVFIAGKSDGITGFNHIGFMFGSNASGALNLGTYIYNETNNVSMLSEGQVLFQVDDSGMLNSPESNSNMSINVTTFSDVGGYVDFDFSGTFFYEGVEHNIIGTAHLVRDP